MVLTAVAFNSCWYGKLVWVEFNFFKVKKVLMIVQCFDEMVRALWS